MKNNRYLVVNYKQQPDGKYSEAIAVTDKIKNNELQYSSIILDYKDRIVVKLRIPDQTPESRDFDKLSAFYKTHYSDIVSMLELKWDYIADGE